MSQEKKGLTYASAGVDIDAGNKAVALMKESVRSTFRPGVLTDIGGFGGLFALDVNRYPQPVLVSGTDGVGTVSYTHLDVYKRQTLCFVWLCFPLPFREPYCQGLPANWT